MIVCCLCGREGTKMFEPAVRNGIAMRCVNDRACDRRTEKRIAARVRILEAGSRR